MRLAGERGFTLVELLIGMTLSLIVLGATLTTFNNLFQAEHDNDARNDSAELARNALDVQVRQLRNISKRVSSPVIDTAAAYDLIFQTADPSRTWVRYCLDTAASPASTDRGRLWTAELVVPSASVGTPVTSAMRGPCPGAGWTTTRVVADHVTNRRGGLDNRPLFTYTCTSGTSCAAVPASYDQIVNVAAQTLVDTTPATGPAELTVRSSAFLRNKNQAPVASFVWTPSATSRSVVLNAAGSSDFEGRTMTYYWFKGALPAPGAIDCAKPSDLRAAQGYLTEGVAQSITFPATDGVAGSLVTIGLIVCDPGDRYATSTLTVTIPS